MTSNDSEAWEDDLLRRYPSPGEAQEQDGFRKFESGVRPSVERFYQENHRFQTYGFVLEKRDQYLGLNQARMGIWEAMEFLNQLVDDSDPDIDLPQIEHLLQTAEAIRADGHPGWFILAGLIHDLGKILCLWGEPQWAVVGDTFPVGCAYSERIVYYSAFEANPDRNDPRFNTQFGVYQPNCGLDQVMLSWGHDEYLYHVVKDHLPAPALAMIRYHSCYPIHRENAYQYLLQESDQQQLNWVRAFNHYDLYTKRDERMDVAKLRPFYENLIAEYFPATLAW